MDKGDASPEGLRRIGELHRLPFEVDGPRVCRQNSPEDVHQGGFPRTVFSNQGTDFTAIDGDGHILKYLVAPE